MASFSAAEEISFPVEIFSSLFQTAAVSLSLATLQIYPTSSSTRSPLPTSSTPAGAWSTPPWAGPSYWSVGSRTWATELSVLAGHNTGHIN